ncbi:hypothetical protein [Skermania piniformis]|uniref:Transposase n=1 Tax=Skermania pinensis TaxID=39122 RepID=A0ABX8S8J1_9ACTN|nr:hypothetical protein [Skermania piniformis]QXQ13482.1 hypothetical protein KV203_16915 [Skermania piniformis]
MGSGAVDLDLPDQGELLARAAGGIGGERVTALVWDEVQRVRRPGGELLVGDLKEYKKPRNGPLFVLAGMLGMEAMRVGAWAQASRSVGRFSRKRAYNDVSALCHAEGLRVAVLHSLREYPDRGEVIPVLRATLSTTADEDMVRILLPEALRKWKR